MSDEVVVSPHARTNVTAAAGLPGRAITPVPRLLLTDVLDQYARNFVLNELSEEQSLKRLEAASREVTYMLARRAPRRRNSTLGQVHQARLSIRRLRSTLRTFGDFFDPEWSTPLLGELSWYGGALGEVRDLDVLRTSITDSLGLIQDVDAQHFVTLRLNRLINEARERCAVEKSTKRYACVVDEVATLVRSIRFSPSPKVTTTNDLASLLKPAWRELKKARRVAQDDQSNENLHQLRIEVKHVQCGCEMVGMVEGAPALRVARAAETAQKKLGVVHDQASTRQWLRALTVAEPNLNEALAEIEDFHNQERKVARRGWRDSMDDVKQAWSDWDEVNS
ncbi:MAG: CHAD domain-containing protein [Acidimicrobiales bacterium]